MRRKADALARERTARTPEDSATLSPDDIRETLHELRVHRIELEMQNEELRRAQTEIEAGRARYFDLYDLAPVGYCTLSEQGLILEANLTAATLLGKASSVLVKRPLSHFILREDQNTYYLHRKQLFETGAPQECDLRLVKADGASFWAHLTATVALAEGGAPSCRVVLIDITERKQAEEALRVSEENFRAIADCTVDWEMWFGPDGALLWVNPAVERRTGYSVAECFAQPRFPESLIHEDDRERMRSAWQEALAGSRGDDLEFRYVRKDGAPGWGAISWQPIFGPNGKPLGHRASVREITERKQAEVALLEREEQLRSIASSIPGAIYQFVRRVDGTFEIPFMSEGARLLFDRPLEELQDPSRLFDDVHPEDMPGLWASIEASARDLTPWSTEFRLVPKTAPLRWLRGTSNPQRMPDGGTSWYGVLLDITEQKRGDEQTRLQHTLALALAAASDLQQGLRLCLQTALQGSGLDAGGFYLVEESSGALDFLVPHGLSSEFVHAVSRYEATSDHTRLVMAGSPVFARLEDLGLSLSEAERREGLRFAASIPLHYAGKVIGSMNVASHAADDIPPATRQALETIAATATQAIVRLRAQERLRASETLLNQTQRLSKVGGWDWDIGRQRMMWTEETYRLHDLSPQDFAPGSDEHVRRSAACYGPEQQAAILEAFRRCAERGEAYDLEVPFTSVKGRSVWVRTTAQAVWEGNRIVKVVGNLMDITERKQAEEKLAESEARFRAANDASLDALLLLRCERDESGEIRDFIFVDLNRRTEEMLRMGREQLLGKRLCEVLPVNREAGFLEKYKGVVDTGIPLEEEFFLPETDVPSAWYYHQVVKVGDGIFICHRDIGDRKRAEDEQRKLQAQFLQAQKMESVGRLAGGVAHDFNNLLMAIMNYTELCRDGVPAEHPIRPWLDEITAESQRSANLVRQLLAFARKQIAQPKALDLNEQIGGMLKMLGRLIGEHIDLTWSPAAALRLVSADPAHIDQVMANLCVNAADAITGNGRIAITTRNLAMDATACAGLPGMAPGRYVLLTVADTGCGMDADTLTHAFEPFFTTKGVGRGTGLGLATVYGIVRQSNGFIHVDSAPGAGTTFSLYLPAIEDEQTEPASPAPVEPPPRGTETILVVDDEKSIRLTVAAHLDRLGYAVLTADGPETALRLARQHVGVIHLLLSDMVMPGMSGVDLRDRLLSERPGLKTIIITGYTAAEFVEPEGKGTDTAHLTKPVPLWDLALAIRSMLSNGRMVTK